MILIIDNQSKNLVYIKKILRELHVNYIVKNQKSLFKFMDYHRIKGVILSGGIPNLDKKLYFNKIRANIASLINYDVPIFGICEGHEIIGESCGGEVLLLKKPSENKSQIVKILKKANIFKNLPSEIGVYEHHSRYVKNVPHELEIIASSTKNKVEGLRHVRRPIYSVQFHPERSGKVGIQIFKNFLEICKKHRKK